MSGITDLLESMQIFAKYDNGDSSPTHCEHDVIGLHAVDVSAVSDEDKERLDELGWHISEEYGEEHFASFRFGSC